MWRVQDSSLKQALVDYLERRHHCDTELYTMVALHFSMHREIAAMLQTSAYRLLSQCDLGKHAP